MPAIGSYLGLAVKAGPLWLDQNLPAYFSSPSAASEPSTCGRNVAIHFSLAIGQVSRGRPGFSHMLNNYVLLPSKSQLLQPPHFRGHAEVWSLEQEQRFQESHLSYCSFRCAKTPAEPEEPGFVLGPPVSFSVVLSAQQCEQTSSPLGPCI